MKIKTILLALLAATVLSSATSCTSEESAVEEDEIDLVHPQMVFENEFARAVRVLLDPGQKLATHDGVDRLIYSLTDYTIEWIENGESLGERNWSAGDIHMHGADTHAAINIGPRTAEWMAFARISDLPDGEQTDIEHDVTSLDGQFAELLFDDELFRVTKIKLEPGEAILPHEGTHRIIFSLSDYTIQYDSEKTGTRERSFESGDVHWHELGTHSLENIGDSIDEFLVIAYK